MVLGTGLRRLLSGTLAVTALAVSAALVPASSSQASSAAGPRYSISLTGDEGSYFLSGRSWDVLSQTWNYGKWESIDIRAGGFTLDFNTPEGSGRFVPRFYQWAQAYPSLDRRPGIAVLGNEPCNSQSGSFEVRDIHRRGVTITRLWLVFERWCDPSQVEFGEVRIGYPRGAYDVSPQVVHWPWTTIYPGNAAQDVPIKVRRTSSRAVRVYKPSVSGADAADFPIRKQNCTGRLTASGCTVWVGFTPSAPGPREARLKVPTSAGPTYVTLDAVGGLGTSNWTVDVSGANPEHLVMNSAAVGNPEQIDTEAFEPQSDGTYLVWDARFGLNNGQPLQAGTTYSFSSSQSPFFMYIARGDSGCEINSGSVKLNDVAWLGPDQDLDRMDAQFTANCTSSAPYSVTARMLFHERADVTPPGRVSNLRAVRHGSRVTVRWTNPSSADLAGVIVRWYPARKPPSAWWTGNAAYFGMGHSVSFKEPAGRRLSIAVWTYDTTGNVGTRKSATVR